MLHAVCELIERDALSVFSCRTASHIHSLRVDPGAFANATVDSLVARIRNAGFTIDLFDLTTNIAVPVVQAVIREAHQPTRMQLDLAAGVGCHAVAAQAAIRAITEAAQTRITNIAGARDDIDPAEYEELLRPGLEVYLEASSSVPKLVPSSIISDANLTARTILEAVKERLQAVNIADIPVVALGGAKQGIAVVKAFAPQLEDRPANRNWRPGKRIVATMLRLW